MYVLLRPCFPYWSRMPKAMPLRTACACSSSILADYLTCSLTDLQITQLMWRDCWVGVCIKGNSEFPFTVSIYHWTDDHSADCSCRTSNTIGDMSAFTWFGSYFVNYIIQYQTIPYSAGEDQPLARLRDMGGCDWGLRENSRQWVDDGLFLRSNRLRSNAVGLTYVKCMKAIDSSN